MPGGTTVVPTHALLHGVGGGGVGGGWIVFPFCLFLCCQQDALSFVLFRFVLFLWYVSIFLGQARVEGKGELATSPLARTADGKPGKMYAAIV